MCEGDHSGRNQEDQTELREAEPRPRTWATAATRAAEGPALEPQRESAEPGRTGRVSGGKITEIW